MTVRNCQECGEKIHPENRTEMGRVVENLFDVLVCDECLAYMMIPDGKVDAWQMQKEGNGE